MARELAPGSVLGGRYRLDRLLGSGGFGSVYAAFQSDLQRTVAIKVLHVDQMFDHEALARFSLEARAAAALGHPNIVQVIDFVTPAGEPPFLVMEYLTGRSLGACLQAEGSLPATRVCLLAYQALSALDVAHRAGIVHRDVKPDNLFVVSMSGIDDFVKLLDFGIAKLVTDNGVRLTDAGTLLGTPSFMAPEQVLGSAVDGRADLYALGATMYFALTGRRPIEGKDIGTLLHGILHQKPPSLEVVLPGIDPRLASVVARAMHKDPVGRFGSAAEMRAALEPWASSRSAGFHAIVPHVSATVAAPVGLAPDTLVTPDLHGRTTGTATRSGRRGVVVVLLVAIAVLLGALAALAVAIHHAGAPSLPSSSSSAPAAPPIRSETPPPENDASPSTPSATPSARTPKEPIAKRIPMTGRNPAYSGGRWTGISSKEARPALDTALPAITRCHRATEFEPPLHESTEFLLTLSATGDVLTAERASYEKRHPAFDACMITALRAVRWPASAAGASLKLSFYARI